MKLPPSWLLASLTITMTAIPTATARPWTQVPRPRAENTTTNPTYFFTLYVLDNPLPLITTNPILNIKQ